MLSERKGRNGEKLVGGGGEKKTVGWKKGKPRDFFQLFSALLRYN